MAKYKPEDVVGTSGAGTGIVKTVSSGEEGTRYLIQFDEGATDWFPEDQVPVLLQRDSVTITKKPRRSGWTWDSDLKDYVLDAWYNLAPDSFDEAFDMFEGYGAGMLEWLRQTNENLYHAVYVKGHKLMGVKLSKVAQKED